MTALGQIIKAQIGRFGPMRVADYMALCLLHPEHGYYTTNDPFGAEGDFITAPEISQMFGEMLGLALIKSWQDQGRPAHFLLVEPGPGRATLMADILRTAAHVRDFSNAADIHLIEASPALRTVQETRLAGKSVTWCDSLAELPDAPLFLIANEFFDALPVRQFKRAGDGWQEQMIGMANNTLIFGQSAPMPVDALNDLLATTAVGQIAEIRPAAEGMMAEIGRRIATFGGAALILDYGAWGSSGDTFQAVRSHKKVDPLACPGQADLTAHVDFRALAQAIGGGAAHSPLIPQGVLLERLGITTRAQHLAQDLEGEALDLHIAAHRRLTHPDEMGALFKALAIFPKTAPPPPGFENHDA